MEEPINGSVVESSPLRNEIQIDEAFDLLELCWFFENLLDKRKPRMINSISDPCLSKVAHQVFVQSPADNVCCTSTTLNLSSSDNVVCKRRTLLRTPSLPSRMGREEGEKERENGSSEHGVLQKLAKPPYVERKEEGSQGKESSGIRRSKQTRKSRHTNLQRAPSLPPVIGREKESEEKETAARIRNSTQPNLSDQFFPSGEEIFEKSLSASGCRMLISNDNKWHQLLIQMRRRRSLSELESEEVQGFKDLGFSFDKRDINPTVVDIIPGLREKREKELLEIERVKRPYLSEAWMLPPIPKWDSMKSAEDMKQQIKFWARAVASNVN